MDEACSMPMQVARAVAVAGEAIGAELDGVRAARDAEHVHRCRVASRRGRAALALALELGLVEVEAAKAARRDLRRLGTALGAARDCDVQLEWLEGLAGPRGAEARTARRLARRLRRRRAALQPEVRRAVRRATRTDLVGRLDDLGATAHRAAEAMTTDPAPIVASVLEARVNVVLSAAAAVDPTRDESLHPLRIALKRLRYALEPIADSFVETSAGAIDAARSLQRRLGVIQDAVVRAALLDELAARERARRGGRRSTRRLERGLRALARRMRRTRETARSAFEASWLALDRGAALGALAGLARREEPASTRAESTRRHPYEAEGPASPRAVPAACDRATPADAARDAAPEP